MEELEAIRFDIHAGTMDNLKPNQVTGLSLMSDFHKQENHVAF